MKNTNRSHGARWLAKLLGLGMILVGVAAVLTAIWLLVTLPIWWGEGPSLPLPVQVALEPDSGLLPFGAESPFRGTQMDQLTGYLKVQFTNPWAQTAYLFFALQEFIIAFMIIFFLGDIVGSISAGEAFSSANARRLRWVGGLMILQHLVGPGFSVIVSKIALHGLDVAGATMNVAWFRDFGDGGFIAGWIILILSEVFRQGAEMKREQSLTI